MKDITKNILLHCGNIVVTNPNLIFENIGVLKEYGIPLSNDDNNNGYTILGMNNLKDRLDYLIKNNLWTGKEGNLDPIDHIRGLIIKDGYMTCKNSSVYDKIGNTSPNDEIDEVHSRKVA